MENINYLQMAVQFIGGLGLFVFGMHVMATGLQKSAGHKMKHWLEVLTKNKFVGILLGAGVTAVIQSSSATTVMVIGFVNAGIMNLAQSASIIMGANIGTTVTAWLVASMEWTKWFSPTALAPLAVAFGAGTLLFSKSQRARQWGEILVGFGILFMGMELMSSTVKPLRDIPAFKELFVSFGRNPVLGILVGALVTAVIQSSSASVGILQALAVSGLVPWNAALYIILGQNIGTCITALLSSIGATKNAKSAAYIHLLFNVLGCAIFGSAAVAVFAFSPPTLGTNLISATEISVVHSIFNIASVILLFPFTNQIIAAAQKLTGFSRHKADDTIFMHLDNRMLFSPSLAIESCTKEVVRIGGIALDSLKSASQALMEKDANKVTEVKELENKIDLLQQGITEFIVKIFALDLTNEENQYVSDLLHAVDDIERIGDHSENLSELAQYAIDESIVFSSDATKELNTMYAKTIDCLATSLKALDKDDLQAVNRTDALEKDIDTLEKNMRNAHIARLSAQTCLPKNGITFLDTLTNLERISDHSLNIAQITEHNYNFVKPKTKVATE